jgi:hypothetical protein
VPSNTRFVAPLRHVISGARVTGFGARVLTATGFDLTFGPVTGRFSGVDSPTSFLLTICKLPFLPAYLLFTEISKACFALRDLTRYCLGLRQPQIQARRAALNLYQ